MLKSLHYLLNSKQIEKFQWGEPAPNNSILTFLYEDHKDAISDSSIFDFALDSIRLAFEISVDSATKTLAVNDFEVLNRFPGEHYKLLAALIRKSNIKFALEIGTYRGFGTLAIIHGLNDRGRVLTNDLISYHDMNSVLDHELENRKRFSQFIGDLSLIENSRKLEELVVKNEFLFLDGPKDGVFEYRIISAISKSANSGLKYIFIDDIKFQNMIPLWRSILSPKVDLTSFGHWSGSGLIDVSKGLFFDSNYWTKEVKDKLSI